MEERAVHLVHGMGTALEAPTWPAITEPEAAAILSQFPAAGQLAEIRWHSPRPFSAAAIVATDKGEFLVKRHHRRLRTPGALSEEHAFIAHLRAAGAPVPEVLTTHDGWGAVALDDGTYEMHRRSPGTDLYRDRQSWTPFLSMAHAHEAGAALARLHHAAQGFAAPARGPHPLVSGFTIVPAHDPMAAVDAYVAARPALARFLAGRSWRAELSALFAALGQGLAERLAGEPPLWTHNDWHPSNLLWSANGGASTVFDFGLATQTCALHDLATAIERSAIAWLDLPDGGDMHGDAAAALAILGGYVSVAPLTAMQIDTLVRLLPLVHVEFALSEIDYFAGVLKDDAQAMMAWRDYLMGHAEWFVSAPGRAFLKQVAHGAGL